MRIARITTPGVVHHVISRFVDREWFFRDDEERANYLRLLGRALCHSDWTCLAYALMSNHIHLALVAGELPLESWARRVNSPFAHWMNVRHGRIGPMFANRPNSHAIQPHHDGRVIAYIHNNPVRAGVVARASDSRWTSHAAYCGLVKVQPWLRRSDGLERAGFSDHPREFDVWVNETIGLELPDSNLVEVSHAVRHRGAIELATPTLGSRVVPLVRRPFGRIRPDPREVAAIVSELVGVSLPMLCSKLHRFADLRCVVAQSGRMLGLTGSDIAAVLGVSQQAVSRMTYTRLPVRLRRTCDDVVERVRKL